MIQKLLTALCGTLVLAWSAVPAAILDQQYDASSSNFIVADRLNLAQTFTVGTSGMFTSAAVEIMNNCVSSTCSQPKVPLVVDVRRTVGGKPVEANSGADILGTASLAWLDSPFGGPTAPFVWVTFNFAGFAVTAGDVLALVLTAPGSGSAEPYLWQGDHGLTFAPKQGTYVGGREYLRFGGGTWGDYPGQSSANGDFSFRTFVDTAAQAVPEPGSFVLVIVALAGASWARRGRRAH